MRDLSRRSLYISRRTKVQRVDDDGGDHLARALNPRRYVPLQLVTVLLAVVGMYTTSWLPVGYNLISCNPLSLVCVSTSQLQPFLIAREAGA